jgi:glycosyltransferase involved in cell wall biosynthesis
MPSYQEAFGQTPIEAMACGTPVITFPCGVSQNLINQDNGILCDDYTVDSLVKGIKLAMSRNYNREKIREDVINRFSYQKIAKQYVELYDTVLKKNYQTPNSHDQ